MKSSDSLGMDYSSKSRYLGVRLETPRNTPYLRKIVHVDMDAFFASVEQLDRPELRGKPVVVGGSPESRGVVSAASYEARKYGVRSAMSTRQAKALCPHAVFVYPRFDRYVEISKLMRSIFAEVTDLVEPLSLDEAYLDVTENKLGMKLARDVAQWIKKEIFTRSGGLTASAGVGPSKLVAKIASDVKKPNGLTVIPPEKILDFLAPLSVGRLWGVGAVTEKRLKLLGYDRVEQLRAASPDRLEDEFGKFGRFLWDQAHGRDDREVDPSQEKKSMGSERTFSRDITDVLKMENFIEELAQELGDGLCKDGALIRTVTIKVRYFDFKTITRQRTLPFHTRSVQKITNIAMELLRTETEVQSKPVRLLGVSVSQFYEPYLWEQLVLPLEEGSWS